MIYLAYALGIAAIAVMAVDLVQAVRLKRRIVGGELGRKWGHLTTLIAVFFVCYLFVPLLLLLELPLEYSTLLVFLVFLFGAVFVLVVIGLMRDALVFLHLLRK